MALQFFNPNTDAHRRASTPEGHAGANPLFFLPFYSYGYWSPNGLQYTFLNSEIPQKATKPTLGITRPNTFRKDASSCNGAPAVI